MAVLAVTGGRLARLATALVARVLAAPRGGHPLAGVARLADPVVRADGAVREPLALVTAGGPSGAHPHAMRAVTGRAGEREQGQGREPDAVIGDSHHIVLLRDAYVSARPASITTSDSMSRR